MEKKEIYTHNIAHSDIVSEEWASSCSCNLKKFHRVIGFNSFTFFWLFPSLFILSSIRSIDRCGVLTLILEKRFFFTPIPSRIGSLPHLPAYKIYNHHLGFVVIERKHNLQYPENMYKKKKSVMFETFCVQMLLLWRREKRQHSKSFFLARSAFVKSFLDRRKDSIALHKS